MNLRCRVNQRRLLSLTRFLEQLVSEVRVMGITSLRKRRQIFFVHLGALKLFCEVGCGYVNRRLGSSNRGWRVWPRDPVVQCEQRAERSHIQMPISPLCCWENKAHRSGGTQSALGSLICQLACSDLSAHAPCPASRHLS